MIGDVMPSNVMRHLISKVARSSHRSIWPVPGLSVGTVSLSADRAVEKRMSSDAAREGETPNISSASVVKNVKAARRSIHRAAAKIRMRRVATPRAFPSFV